MKIVLLFGMNNKKHSFSVSIQKPKNFKITYLRRFLIMGMMKDLMIEIEGILTDIKGWSCGEIDNTIVTLEDAFENCEYIYCTEEELVEVSNNSSDPARIKPTYASNSDSYIWEYDSITHSFIAKKELTDIVKNLMFKCLLKGTK